MPVYEIPYGDKTLSCTAEHVIFHAAARHPEPLPDPDELIRTALDAPIGAPALEELVRPGSKVALIVDDITRPTPRQAILRHLSARLDAIPGLDVSLIIALGTHRPMTDEEIRQDLGEFARRYPVVNISYLDTERYAMAGKMPDGTSIMVYREVLEADTIIGIGNIVPHIAAGWGGGAKIIMPGVCGEETTNAIHNISNTQQDLLLTCGGTDNLFRRTMEELAARVGLSWIVNTVLDEQGRILGVFAGDFIQAHRAGVAFAEKVLCPPIPAPADILIVSANPANADFWQGAKPFIFAHRAVRRGGVMILLLSAKSGICGCAPAHEQTIRKYYNAPPEVLHQVIAEKSEEDILGVGEAFIRVQTKDYCTVLLISEGISAEDARLLGFEKMPSLEQALEKAHRLMGEDAAIGIIPHGGEMLCRLTPPV